MSRFNRLEQDRQTRLPYIIIAIKLNEGKFRTYKQIANFINNELNEFITVYQISKNILNVAVKENNRWITKPKCTSVIDVTYGYYDFLLKYLQPEDLVITSMRDAFRSRNLSEIAYKISKLDVSNVKDFESCFHDCQSSNIIDLSNWDMSNAQIVNDMFDYCRYRNISFKFGKFNWKNVIHAAYTFQNFTAESNLNEVAPYLFAENTNEISLSGLFEGCSQIYDANLSNWKITLPQYSSTTFAGSTFFGKLPEEIIKHKNILNGCVSNVTDSIYISGVNEVIVNCIKNGISLEIISKLISNVTLDDIRKVASKFALGIMKEST